MSKLYFIFMAGILLSLPLFAVEPEHPHVEKDADGNFYPAMGYRWVNAKEGDFNVLWHAGVKCKGHPGVYTTETEGKFIPEVGYVWSSVQDLQVSWMPGIEHSKVPHVFAMAKEKFFLPEPGYVWADGEGGKNGIRHSPKWVPGAAYPDLSRLTDFPRIYGLNVVASDQEGLFIPAPGYTWAGGGTEKRADPQKVYRDKIKNGAREISGPCEGFRSVSPAEAAAVVTIFMGVKELSKALQTDLERAMPSIQAAVSAFTDSHGSDHGGGGRGRETRESMSSPGGHSVPQ